MKKLLFSTFLIFSLISVEAGAMPMPEITYQKSDDCPKETPFLGASLIFGNKCIGCDYVGTIEIERGHEKDFEICKNRESFTYNNLDYQSRLKECPKESPLRTVNGCENCSFLGIVWGKSLTKEMCDLCSGAIYYKTGEAGVCSQCPSDKPMAKSYEFGRTDCNDCYSEMIEFSEAECNKCSNRKYVSDLEGGVCLRKKLNSDEVDIPPNGWNFITDGVGLVYSYRLTPELESGYVPSPGEVNVFMSGIKQKDSYKNSKSCNSYMTDFTEEECVKCSNRKYIAINHPFFRDLGKICVRKIPNSDKIEIPSGLGTDRKALYEYNASFQHFDKYEYWDSFKEKVKLK